MAEGKTYRTWTAEQKLEIVLAGIKSGNIERTCREHEISSTLYYRWASCRFTISESFRTVCLHATDRCP